jgi:hypothetical protein
MKRVLPVVMAAALVAGGAGSLYSKEKKEVKKVDSPVAATEKVTASQGAPEGVQVILKGMAALESSPSLSAAQVVIKTETGQTYFAFNAPYVNTLRFNCIGKKVKVKGINVTKTTFKGYPGIYVQDILEVK